MKKLTALFVLFVIALAVKAQSETETLEWLRAKQQAVNAIYSNDSQLRNAKLTLNEVSIKVTNGESTIDIQWSNVKDVTMDFDRITVVSNDLVDSKNTFIRFRIADQVITAKYVKALKHMATLKGAKMVKDDLF